MTSTNKPLSQRDTLADGSLHRNLEFKARLLDLGAAIRVAKQLRAMNDGEDLQVDIYYRAPSGRLKLREVDGAEGQIIYYERPDQATERWSHVQIAPVADAVALDRLLGAALGIRGSVRKRRQVWLWNGCRIHLDDVEGLGQFIEFEVLSQGDPVNDHRRMEQLLKAFSLSQHEAIPGSYADLLGL